MVSHKSIVQFNSVRDDTYSPTLENKQQSNFTATIKNLKREIHGAQSTQIWARKPCVLWSLWSRDFPLVLLKYLSKYAGISDANLRGLRTVYFRGKGMRKKAKNTQRTGSNLNNQRV